MMNSTIYYSVDNIATQKIDSEEIILKGTNTLSVVLTGMPENTNDIIFLEIDWGDGKVENYSKSIVFDYKTQSIFNEILYGKLRGSVAGIYTHIYSNNTQNYNSAFRAVLTMTYDNGSVVKFIQPVYVVSDSFYDRLVDLKLLKTQLLPLEDNNTILTFETKENNMTLFGILSGENAVTQISPLVPEEGFVFVFTQDNQQVFNHLGQPVQVSDQFANSN